MKSFDNEFEKYAVGFLVVLFLFTFFYVLANAAEWFVGGGF